MARKLLFAVDFSPYTEKLLGCAGELASAGLNEVIVLNVVEDKGGAKSNTAALEDDIAEAEDKIDKLADQLEEEGLKVARVVKTGNPAQVIVETASEEDVDLIFMGAQGKGLRKKSIVGSVSERVLKLADRSVMIQHCRVNKKKGGYTCENACSNIFGNILMASDFSKYGASVRPLLVDLAQTFCTPITLLHVQEGKEDGGYQVVIEAEREKIKDKMQDLQELSYEMGDYCKSVRVDIVNGSPPSAILAYAEEIDASLIVLGAYGAGGAVDNKLGKVAEKIIGKSERPVLVLKARR
jgi:nucleotide-binding universal stress UspA family protein